MGVPIKPTISVERGVIKPTDHIYSIPLEKMEPGDSCFIPDDMFDPPSSAQWRMVRFITDMNRKWKGQRKFMGKVRIEGGKKGRRVWREE